MAKIKSFRELDVWNCAMSLVLLCYKLSDALPKNESYGLTAQLRRAAASVPANIAEGHNRRSERAYLNHVNIALGSQAELDTLLELSQRLKYLSDLQSDAFALTSIAPVRCSMGCRDLSNGNSRCKGRRESERRAPSAGRGATIKVVDNSVY